ncbi:hypothetical protein Cgig2_007126 [Carnegiea gigantea]|uniref:Reverse transcriptase zinc-binding domain-containing protein n=1 Tax=Carnegiea gigantea TaxID=171969 RepID=A0A9Q1JY59_9CARY|nr:hypothetical protein Cgig2_007126 [Carnegiea gigantea]
MLIMICRTICHSVKCSPATLTRVAGKRHFHFENMWAADPSCGDDSSSRPDVVDNLLIKLDGCSAKLNDWNKTTFGHIGIEIRKSEVMLKSQGDAISRKQLLGQIRELRKKDEVLWWQRTRSNYLKYGYVNTRWFHSHVNLRRAKNTITGLRDEDGNWCTSLDEISTIITNFFGTFTVQSAYHMIINDHLSACGSSYMADNGCDIPPRIKFFGWRVCRGMLLSALNISKRVRSFDMSYSVCAYLEESDIHAILECPLAA